MPVHKIYENIDSNTTLNDSMEIVNVTSLSNIGNNKYAVIRLSGSHTNVAAPFILIQKIHNKIRIFATNKKYHSVSKLINDILINPIDKDIVNINKIDADISEFVKYVSRSRNSAFAPRIVVEFENNENSMKYKGII